MEGSVVDLQRTDFEVNKHTILLRNDKIGSEEAIVAARLLLKRVNMNDSIETVYLEVHCGNDPHKIHSELCRYEIKLN